jgi:hypothetical protein
VQINNALLVDTGVLNPAFQDPYRSNDLLVQTVQPAGYDPQKWSFDINDLNGSGKLMSKLVPAKMTSEEFNSVLTKAFAEACHVAHLMPTAAAAAAATAN